ncbi:MAG: alpha-E domain-containing protein, partial [Pseudomonadota bacterium]
KHPAPEHWSSIRHLMLDRDNPSSVVSCFEAARANARSARAAITVEMWEAVNDAWIDARKLAPEQLENGSMSPLVDWVKGQSGRFRGAAESTMLRNDGYEFWRLGVFLERIDNTARLLDVKCYLAAARGEEASVDQYEWASLLRAAGVLRAYNVIYKTAYRPERVAEFLLLNPQCPRSLSYCTSKVRDALQSLERLYGRRDFCHDFGDALCRHVEKCDVAHLMDGRLREALTATIRYANAVSAAIAEAYHFAPRPAVDLAEAEAQADDQQDSEASATEIEEQKTEAREAATLARAQVQTQSSVGPSKRPSMLQGVAASPA